MDNCKIIADLLPSYCDGLTGLETNHYIRDHLNSCSDCRRLLEKMQQNREEQKEITFRRAQFKAALAVYERAHRTRVCLLMLAFLLIIAIFFVVRAFSFDLAIMSSGLRRDTVEVVQQPTTDAGGNVFQIIYSQTKEDDCVLAWLTKNVIGFWVVDAIETATLDRPYGAAQMTWSESIFSYHGGEPHITVVFHGVYAGNNAIGVLEQLPQERIPGNVAVFINQNYGNYYMHVISVLPNGGTAFDILPLLEECNLIS